jgi:hypothetical protein
MVRTVIDLDAAGRLAPMPFVGEDRRAVAWLEIGGAGQAAVFGAPSVMRELAAAATFAADQAEELLRVAELLAAAGTAGSGIAG